LSNDLCRGLGTKGHKESFVIHGLVGQNLNLGVSGPRRGKGLLKSSIECKALGLTNAYVVFSHLTDKV
jgi:hypothetical protein